MKRLILLLAVLCMAPSIIDQLDADFATGTATDINITGNTLILNGSPGTYSATGTFLSSVKELGSNPVATISWNANTTAPGTSILVTTRSGNVTLPDADWASWSSPYVDNAGSIILSPRARYYQYRLQLGTTNASNTPTVNSIILIYTEQGPDITAGTHENLTSTSTGEYAFTVLVLDTVSLVTVRARYAIGANSSSAYEDMQQSGNNYSITIPEPAGTWNGSKGQLLRINVYAQNSAGNITNVTFNETIDAVNHPPVLATLTNFNAVERETRTFTVSAYDPDGDALTFNTTHGTITSTSATTGLFSWTPTNSEVGLRNVTITVSDGELTDTQTVTANVTDVNTAPYMRPITSQTGHYGDTIIFDVTVVDNDTAEILTWTVTPQLFTIEEYNRSETSTLYRARATFVALDDHRGHHELLFTVTDAAGESSSRNATLTTTYCGDGTCQAQEDETTCPQDCAASQKESYVVVELPDRHCVNETHNYTAFNASSRFTCYYEGRTHQGNAWCQPQDRANILIYKIDDIKRTKITEVRSAADGTFQFTPTESGEYKMIVSREGFISSSYIITVRACADPIDPHGETITFPKPQIRADPTPVDNEPRTERPALTNEDATLLSIIIWYILIPLLGAALLYTGNIWYDMNKDYNASLLKMRLWAWETQTRYEPLYLPYLRQSWEALQPFVQPVWQWLRTNAVDPLGRLLQPIIRFIRR